METENTNIENENAGGKSEPETFDFRFDNQQRTFLLVAIANSLQRSAFDLGRAAVASPELAQAMGGQVDATMRLLTSLTQGFLVLPEDSEVTLTKPAVLMIRDFLRSHVEMQSDMSASTDDPQVLDTLGKQKKVFLNLIDSVVYDGVEGDEKEIDERAQVMQAKAESQIITPENAGNIVPGQFRT